MKKIILDTNAYCNFLAGDEKVFDVLAKAQITYNKKNSLLCY